MKKVFLSALIATALANSVNAQDKVVVAVPAAPPERFHVGAKIGINLSNVYNARGEQFDADSKVGLAVGGFMSIPIAPFIGVQPELLYSQKGFHARGNILGSPYDITRTTSYIDIPLFFAFKPTPSISLLAGPQYSYLLRQKDIFKNAFTTIAQEREFQNDDLNTNTLCFVTGVDVNLYQVVVSARAGWDVRNNYSNGSSSTPRYKNTWFQATIGVRI